jgi:hypothetical protein
MKRNLTLIFIFTLGLMIFTSSCNNNDDPADPTYTLTQADLNKATAGADLNVTGTKYGEDVSIPHNGQPVPPGATYRDIYTQTTKSVSANGLGTIYTKRTYAKNADGSKGDLLVTFAMAKRETGYFTEGGDWEYVMMPNDGSTNYGTNPNGMLPIEGSEMRGQLANCASCHAKAADDFLFVNDVVPDFIAKQADLNAAVNPEDLNVTGTKYGADVSVPHNGMPISPDSTFRDIYSGIGSNVGVNVGTIFTKGTFMKNADGSKGPLQVTFAMIKREEGYYPDGGDFEYVMMPYDASNDYETNPNGLLPEVGSAMRGQLANCASCHAKVGGYLFSRGGLN